MKKTIQTTLRKLLLMSSLFLLGITCYGQFTYEPGKTYTFRTLISPTQTIQIEVVYDAEENAKVTLTNVSPEPSDKAFSHIFLPENDEYSFDKNTGGLIVSQNQSMYKKIEINTGGVSDFTKGPKTIPICPGCETGSGGCQLSKIQTGGGCWQICCVDGDDEPVCIKCKDLKWVEDKDKTSSGPILVLRVGGNITIQ